MQCAKPKAQQNTLLYPGVYTPACRRALCRGRSSHFALFKRRAQGQKCFLRRRIGCGCGACGKVPLNLLLKILDSHSIKSLSIQLEAGGTLTMADSKQPLPQGKGLIVARIFRRACLLPKLCGGTRGHTLGSGLLRH